MNVDHLGLGATRVVDEVLGDGSSVLRVQLGLPMSPELGPDRVEHVARPERPHGAHGAVGAPHGRADLSRRQAHARMQQEEGRDAEQDRLRRDGGHEPHRCLQQDPLRPRGPLQHVRMLALPALPTRPAASRSPASSPCRCPWSPPGGQASHREASRQRPGSGKDQWIEAEVVGECSEGVGGVWWARGHAEGRLERD